MNLLLQRFSSGDESTLGNLFAKEASGLRFLCFVLEDQYQTKKVYAETRIPAGTYQLGIRAEGGFHQRYSRRFAGIHRGMIQVQDVPGFEYVLLHIGNTDDDTAGCLLLGNGVDHNASPGIRGGLRNSVAAYRRVYPQIMEGLEAGQTASLEILDLA